MQDLDRGPKDTTHLCKLLSQILLVFMGSLYAGPHGPSLDMGVKPKVSDTSATCTCVVL